VLSLSRLFAPDPDHPERIAASALALPLPVGLSSRLAAADEFLRFLGSPFADVRRLAAEAVAAIQEAARQQQKVSSHFCRRCRQRISQDEYRASMERFGNPYCHHCQDEKELESRDFESTVEGAKKKRTTGGTAVQSWGEKRIAEFLEAEKITYYYDERYRITGADTIRPDSSSSAGLFKIPNIKASILS